MAVHGDDDSGALGAWYVFASIGIFPHAGDDFYYLSSPYYESTVLNLENGNTFKLLAKNLSHENKYIQWVELNGKRYNKITIKHSDIMRGGELVFHMGSTPKNFAEA